MVKINTTIGFVGVGGIASALIKGFCSYPNFTGKVIVCNRHVERSEAVRSLFPNQVIVAETNQDVINQAEVVFPTLLPKVLREVAPMLKFKKENHVIHLAAGINITESNGWYTPAQSVVRAVPLPFVSKRIGPVVMYGEDFKSEELLSILGSVIKVNTEKDLEILASITGMMVPYYATVGASVCWGISKGIDFQSVLKYTTLMNEALSMLMRHECKEDIGAFLKDNTTPNGMNELGLKITKEAKVYETWSNALEQIGKHYNL
jgi:pyrroline-5-carboxylate reductase